MWSDDWSDLDTIPDDVNTGLALAGVLSTSLVCGVTLLVFKTNVPVIRELFNIVSLVTIDAWYVVVACCCSPLVGETFKLLNVENEQLFVHDRNEEGVGLDL
jgi:hypothetical protein